MRSTTSFWASVMAFGLALLTTAGSLAEAPETGGSFPLKVVALTFCLLALGQLVHRRGLVSWPTSFLPLALLAALCFASNLWTVDSDSSLRASRHLALEVGFFLALAQWIPRRVLLKYLALGAAVGALLHAAWMVGLFAFGSAESGRLVLPGGDANLQAREMALGFVLLFALLGEWSRADRPGLPWAEGLERRLRGGPGSLLAIGILGVGLGVSGSRGTVLAVAVAMAVFAVLSPRVRRARRLGRLLVVALLAMAVGFFATGTREDLRSPLSGVGDGDREAITSGRDAIWANSWEVVLDHPFLGVGLAAVPAVYDTYRDRRMAEGGLRSKSAQDPHNFYLQLLAGLGPAGLLLFMLSASLIWREARGSPLRGQARLVLVFVLLSAMSQSTLELNDFWLALAWSALAASLKDVPVSDPGTVTEKAAARS